MMPRVLYSCVSFYHAIERVMGDLLLLLEAYNQRK